MLSVTNTSVTKVFTFDLGHSGWTYRSDNAAGSPSRISRSANKGRVVKTCFSATAQLKAAVCSGPDFMDFYVNRCAAGYFVKAIDGDGGSKGPKNTSKGHALSSGSRKTQHTSGQNAGPPKGSGGSGGQSGKDNKDLGGNKDGSSKSSNNEALRTAPEADLDMPYMPLSAVEMCTYFPNHTQWPEYMLRLHRNGWRPTQIAHAQLHGRGRLNADGLDQRNGALRHQISVSGRKFYNDQSWTQHEWIHSHPDGEPFAHPGQGASQSDFLNLYDISSWTRSAGVTEPTLQQIANYIRNHPSGQDAGLFTQAMRYAISRGNAYLASKHLSDVPGIIRDHGSQWQWPTDARSTAEWDQRALQRMLNIALR